jgi:5-deoxy-D-glucuronate isomerase
LNQLTSFKSIKLKNLSAEYDGKKITFIAGNETALVFLKDDKISEIKHYIDNNEIILKNAHTNIKVGEKNFKRNVDHYVIKETNQNNLMRIGQTFHEGDGGTWSSLPHEFEKYPEPGFEEFFFYVLSGGSRRAVQVGQGILHDGKKIDSAWIVKDKQFSVIPMGYHPIAGEPNVKVGYIWCYLCTKNEWEKV